MIVCIGTTPTVQRTMRFASLHAGEVNRAASTLQTASGKSVNVARVLTTLGVPCIATGFLGSDSGQFIRRELDEAKIAHDFVEVQPATRTCTTIIDQASGEVTELVEESKQVEAEAWDRLREKIDWLLAQARLVVLSGSLTPGAPQDFYAWCVERAHEKNVRALVDASGEPLKLALEKKPFLVKPNRVELTRTVGTEDLWEGINRLMQTGARNVIVTMGKEGSVAADGRTRWKMAPPGTEVVSPIGSGDAYAAGTAAALDRGDELVEAARLGTACAAANAMTAVSGYLRREDVEAIVPKVQIEMLKH